MTLRIRLSAILDAARSAFRALLAAVRPAFPAAIPLVFLAVATLSALVILAVLRLAADGTATVPPRPAQILAQHAAVTRPAYWTSARMEHALAATPARRGGLVKGTSWRGGGVVAKTTGRVFFTLNGADYTCSGAVVSGPNPNVVVTAAHCVSDGAGAWATNWTFVPGYDGGQRPYGGFAAKTFYVSSQWADGADEDDDVAFVDVDQSSASSVPSAVGQLVGSQPISFGRRARTAAVFGYPAEAPYAGDRLDYCEGPVSPDPYGAADSGLPCGMTEGDSGGPWLSRFNHAAGTGVITGVTSFKYSGRDGTLYSANLGPIAHSVYTRAEQAS